MMGGEENVRSLCLSIESPFIRGWQALLMATSEEIRCMGGRYGGSFHGWNFCPSMDRIPPLGKGGNRYLINHSINELNPSSSSQRMKT